MLTDTKLRNLKPKEKLYKVNDRDQEEINRFNRHLRIGNDVERHQSACASL